MRWHYNSYNVRSGAQKLKSRMALAISAVVLSVSGGGGMALATFGTSHAEAVACTNVVTSKGSLTAAQVGGDVTGELNALGCDIGVYYNSDKTGNVAGADIHDATQYGVFVDGNVADVQVNVTDSSIYNIGDHNGSGEFTPTGGQHGVAVYYNGFNLPGQVSGKVWGNDVSQYQKGGIVANGQTVSVSVRDNTVTGLSPVAFIAQNGIQLGYGATGQVMGNTVDGNWYEGANWASTGILMFESSNVVVQKNAVMGSQTGISVETWCWYGVQDASNNKIINNEVTGADWGVSVAAYNYYSDCDASANNNKVDKNVIVSEGGDTGVWMGAYDYQGNGNFTPEADNNKLIRNEIRGFSTVFDTAMSTTPKVHANVVD